MTESRTGPKINTWQPYRITVTPEMRQYLREQIMIDDADLPITPARQQRSLLEIQVAGLEREIERIKRKIKAIQ